MFKVGMIGTGIIGKNHAEALQLIDNACLSVVCDIVPEKAKVFGDMYTVPFYTDYKEML